MKTIKSSSETKYKSPLNWYGGKYYLAKDIISLFPEHKIYIEGFGGAAHILFRKRRSDLEIYNDINSGLYIFFKCLRNEKTRDELARRIQLTPYSREEFVNCRRSWESETDEIEKARKFYVAIMQSVSSTGKGGWGYSKTVSRNGMCQSVSQWLGNIDKNLIGAIERLREVQIENLDIIDLIKKYDNKNALFYLDPPYIPQTRLAKKVYDNEMNSEKHEELVETLLNIKGKVVLSGYDNLIYNRLEKHDWKKVYLGEYAKRCQKKSKMDKGKEFVWINY